MFHPAQYMRHHPKRFGILGMIILFHILLIAFLLTNTSKEPPLRTSSSSSPLAISFVAPPPPQVAPQQPTSQDYVPPAPDNQPSPLEQISHTHSQQPTQKTPPVKQPPPQPAKPAPPTPVHSKQKSPVYAKKPTHAPPTRKKTQHMAQKPSPGTAPAGAGQQGQGQGEGQGLGGASGPAGSSPINGAKLIYPPQMEAENVEGRVTMRCDVLPSGYTRNCTLVGANGGDPFIASAKNYLSKAQFNPAMHNGDPVLEPQKIFVIRYRLDE